MLNVIRTFPKVLTAVATGAIVAGLLAVTAPMVEAQTPSAGCATPAASGMATSSPVAPSADAALPTQVAAEPEQNPPGDIPDNQAFVTYTSQQGGYSITTPEGWARQEQGGNVEFADKLHQFRVELTCTAIAPTEASASSEAETVLASTLPAFELVAVKSVDLPAGPAVLIQYRINSDTDPVTGKQHRLDVDRYEIAGNGKLAVVTLAGPAGSDNVDVSRQVSESFRWIA